MKEQGIDTYIVNGFLDAGKTTYIQDCIRNDFFHKYGSTLILCFEQGETPYDEDALRAKRTSVAYCGPDEDAFTFCRRAVEASKPDRIYIEMNAMMPDLPSVLPDFLHIVFAVTLIDWKTFPVYYTNFLQMFRQMVLGSHQVVFRDCPSKELLAPYSRTFRLINRSAVYLRQDPMGYHEKAFDLFLPFSLSDDQITIDEAAFLPMWLDAADHPEHYDGKRLSFCDPLELRYDAQEQKWSAGRVVMTCCMADLQFMALTLLAAEECPLPSSGGWVRLEADAAVQKDRYARPVLTLRPVRIDPAAAPTDLILKP